MKEIYYHEDVYCQIEILPISSWQHCAQQMGEIETFSEAHKAPGGVGWTEMYMRPDNPVSLGQAKLSLNSFRRALSSNAQEYGPVYTGYSSYRELSKNTVAFSSSPLDVVLFADHNDDSIIEHIWLSMHAITQEQKNEALTMLESVASLGEFILADWGWCTLIEVKDHAVLEAYLSKRIEVFSAITVEFNNPRRWWEFWKQNR